jgi:hypothetical protein
VSDYRYLVTDVQSGAVVCELPLGSVRLQSLLNGSGSMSGSMKMSDQRVRVAFDEILTQPGRSGLVVLRDANPIWGGVLWTRPYQVDTETISWGGSEWSSALLRRKITTDHAWNGAAIETIVADLIADAQLGTNGEFNMTVAGVTGLTTSHSVLAADRIWALDAIKAVLESTGSAGVDYRTSVTYSGTAIAPVFTLGSPLLGRAGVVNGLTIAEPISGVWAEDATEWATSIYASSRGVGTTSLATVVTNAAALADGYPRWDLEYSSESDGSETSLGVSATAYLNARSPGGAFGPLTCRASDPDVTDLELGDTILVTFSENARFPSGLIADVRVTGWTLTPGEHGGIDTLSLEVSQ